MQKKQIVLIRIIGALIGLAGGFLYWKFIGCNSGTCPITSNWQHSTIVGAIIGYLLGDSYVDFRKKRATVNSNSLSD